MTHCALSWVLTHREGQHGLPHLSNLRGMPKPERKSLSLFAVQYPLFFFNYLYNVSVVYDTFFWERIHGSDSAGMGSSDEWNHCCFSSLHLFISDSFIMERAEITLHFDIWTFSWALLQREERAINKWGSNKCTIECLIILPQPS